MLNLIYDTLDIPVLNTTGWIIPLIEFAVLMGLLVGNMYLYKKLRIWIFILSVFMFNLIFAILSIRSYVLPFTPYIQIFSILIQTLILLLTSLEVRKRLG